MKAVVWHGAKDLRVEDRPRPSAGPGEVVIEVAYCGICGTDLHEYAEGPVLITPRPHPLTGQAPPVILGHEFSGRIVELGEGTEGISVGDRVTVDPYWRCGECWWCRRGDYHICRTAGGIGLASDGALARFVRAQAAGVVPLPDAVPDDLGALVEPLAVGLHALERGRTEPGESIGILGFGPVGAAVALMAKATGIARILVSEPDEGRRALAASLADADGFDPSSDDVRREFYVRTERRGPDVVFECSARPDNVELALSMVRRGGRVVLLGVGHGSSTVTPTRIVANEYELIGSIGYRNDLPRVAEALARGTVDVRPFITRVATLDEMPGIFDALSRKPEGQLKVLVDVAASA